jgi:hypothetical protein
MTVFGDKFTKSATFTKYFITLIFFLKKFDKKYDIK